MYLATSSLRFERFLSIDQRVPPWSILKLIQLRVPSFQLSRVIPLPNEVALAIGADEQLVIGDVRDVVGEVTTVLRDLQSNH
jgi:hypothetical protein